MYCYLHMCIHHRLILISLVQTSKQLGHVHQTTFTRCFCEVSVANFGAEFNVSTKQILQGSIRFLSNLILFVQRCTGMDRHPTQLWHSVLIPKQWSTLTLYRPLSLCISFLVKYYHFSHMIAQCDLKLWYWIEPFIQQLVFIHSLCVGDYTLDTALTLSNWSAKKLLSELIHI